MGQGLVAIVDVIVIHVSSGFNIVVRFNQFLIFLFVLNYSIFVDYMMQVSDFDGQFV